MLSRVVLPQPLGPMIAMNSPFSIVRSRPSSTVCSASPIPYLLVRPCNAITGGVVVAFITSIIERCSTDTQAVGICLLYNSDKIEFDAVRPFRRGEVSEWLKEHAWKACVRQRTAGSNPVLSAKKNRVHLDSIFLANRV